MFIYYDGSGLILHTATGDPKAMPPGNYIEVPDDTLVDLARDKVVDGAHVQIPPDPAEVLAQERAGMWCSPLQGKLALGEVRWAQVEAMLASPTTPFPMRIAISSAVQWDRKSQMMDELGWIMGLTATQIDDLFRAARQIVV